MQQNFARALQRVLVYEGGYVDHPQDPGGATNKGVTLAIFQRFYGASMTPEDLRAITDVQLEHIYKTGYWNTCQCDALPAGIDYVVFDQAVNSGPGQSAKWLQAALGVAVDGGLGPQTMAAAGQRDPVAAINAMCDARLAFLQRLRNGALWQTFGRGWQARVEGVRAAGLQLAAGAAVSPGPVPVAANGRSTISSCGADQFRKSIPRARSRSSVVRDARIASRPSSGPAPMSDARLMTRRPPGLTR